MGAEIGYSFISWNARLRNAELLPLDTSEEGHLANPQQIPVEDRGVCPAHETDTPADSPSRSPNAGVDR